MGLGRRKSALKRAWSARLAAIVLASMLGGCAGFELQGEKPAPRVEAPLAAPRTVGVDALTTAEHKRLIAQFGGEYRWPAAETYLNDILSRLAAASETPTTPYRVTILNTPVVNAFALPSGNLYISRGLLALANDSSEVAAVMAHEIAHVTARHAAARAEREKQAALIAEAASVIQSRQKGEEVESYQRLSFAGFSRQQEIEADRIGVGVIARAGFDPYGAARFLTSLGRSTAMRAELVGQKSNDRPDMLATHPSIRPRPSASHRRPRSRARSARPASASPTGPAISPPSTAWRSAKTRPTVWSVADVSCTRDYASRSWRPTVSRSTIRTAR